MPCQKKYWPTGWHGESLHFQGRSVHRVRITINKSHSSEVHPNQPQGSFFCWTPVSVSCKVISKVPFKKPSLNYNFDHQKQKQQSTFPKESPSGGGDLPNASQNVPNRKNFFKSSLFKPEVSSFVLLMVQKSGKLTSWGNGSWNLPWFTKFFFFAPIPSCLKVWNRQILEVAIFPTLIFTHQRLWNKPFRGFPDPSIPEVLPTWFRPQVIEGWNHTPKGWPIKVVWLLMRRIPNVTQLGNLRLLVRCGWKKWTKKKMFYQIDGLMVMIHHGIREKSPNPYKSKAFWCWISKPPKK